MNSSSTASFQQHIQSTKADQVSSSSNCLVSTKENESPIDDVYGDKKRNESSSMEKQASEARANSTGRPKCDEFEVEVIAECECESSLENNGFDRKRSSSLSSNEYSYAYVKKCAAIVMEKEYWDEGSRSFVKKWQLNRMTNRLCFSNKWVYGMLVRRQLLKKKNEKKKRKKKTSLESSSSSDMITTCHHPSSDCNDASSRDIQTQEHTLEFDYDVFDVDLKRDMVMCSDLERDMCCDLDSSLTGSSTWTNDDDLFLDSCFGFDFDWSL